MSEAAKFLELLQLGGFVVGVVFIALAFVTVFINLIAGGTATDTTIPYTQAKNLNPQSSINQQHNLKE